jgi:outer membrane protein
MFTKLIALCALPAVLGAQQTTDTNTFKPISLADALRLAKENNVSNITAANNVRSNTLAIRSARAQLYPSVTTQLNQSKSSGQRLGQSGTLVDYNAAWTYSTNLRINQTLFDGGKSFADVRARQADVAAAEAGLTSQEFNISFQVKQQYNAILAAKEAEAAARAQLELAKQQLAVSIAKVNAGAAPVVDSLNSVVGVGNAQVNILNAQQNLRAASSALTTLVGTPYLVTSVPADTVDLPRASIDSASLMQWALEGPVIRQYQAQLNSANAVQRSAKAAYMPTVSAGFSYGGNGTAAYGIGSDPFPYSRALSLSVSYPLFNGYQRENAAASAQISAENAQAQIKNQKLAAQQTIITQIGLLRNDEEKMRVQQINIAASEEALRVNQQRYALGAGTLVDLLTSQSNLIVARQQLIQTRLDYRNARAQIEAFIGRDLP